MPTAENGKQDAKPSPKVRKKWKSSIWNRQHRKCHYCQCALSFGKATLDHVTPKSKGGPWKKSNMVVACKPCNNRRGDMDYEDFMQLVKG